MLYFPGMSTEALPLDRSATYADLEALPPNVKGEIIDGVLYTQSRPRPRHAHSSWVIGGELYDPYYRGRGGPGGWWILEEPGIELPGSPEIAPDLAGWRRERMPELPPDDPIRVVPDWVCEVLSPTNRTYDRATKLPYYARVGVGYLWLVDPHARTVEVKRLASGFWTEIAVFAEAATMRAEPFPDAAIDLALLWLKPASGEPSR